MIYVDQAVEFVLMVSVIILCAYVFVKQILKHKEKPKKAVGTVVSKSYSKADEFSASKGYIDAKEIYSVKIKCGEDCRLFKVSETMYGLLEADQKICFEYSGGILYNFEVI